MSYPHGQKQGFFPLSEGLSVMTDPELQGKTAVFLFPRITARSSKQSPIQKRPLAIILEVILYRIRANRQILLRIPKTMYRNSPFFATKSGKSCPQLGWQGIFHRRRVASVKVLLSLRLFAAVRPGLSDTRLPETPVGARRKKTPNKGAEQGVPAPPRPAARFQNYPLLEECIRILLKP